MPWIKKGLIFKPSAKQEWSLSHATMPCVEHLEEDRFAIYFGSRNSQNRSQIGRLIFELDSLKVNYIAKDPVLELGTLGSFDDSAVLPCQLVNFGELKFLYYVGWSLGKTVPIYSFAGLAQSKDGGFSFTRLSKAPLLDRISVDPYLAGTPWILVEEGQWKMWYASGVHWVYENEKPKHYYHIKYATSDNGIDWVREGLVCIDFKSEYEYSIGRPCVLKEEDTYKMWYSYRAGEKIKTSRIGYATSQDGLVWKRMDDEVGIDVSEQGWDSEMICFASVFKHKDKKYLLYNGNNYGETGFGLAIWEEK